MEIVVCPNPRCRRPFQSNRFDASSFFDASINVGEAAGVLHCPHCGLALQGEAGSVYLTHALSKDEEAGLRQPGRRRPA